MPASGLFAALDVAAIGASALALWLIARTLLFLPRRLDSKRTGEMTARKALGLPLFDDVPAAEAPKLAARFLGFILAASTLIILFATGVIPSPSPPLLESLFRVLIAMMAVHAWWQIRRELPRLHANQTASRAAAGLVFDRSGIQTMTFCAVAVSERILPSALTDSALIALAALLTCQAFAQGRSKSTWGPGMTAGFALLTVVLGLTRAPELQSGTAVAAVTSILLLLACSALTLTLLLRRIPRSAQPRDRARRGGPALS